MKDNSLSHKLVSTSHQSYTMHSRNAAFEIISWIVATFLKLCFILFSSAQTVSSEHHSEWDTSKYFEDSFKMSTTDPELSRPVFVKVSIKIRNVRFFSKLKMFWRKDSIDSFVENWLNIISISISKICEKNYYLCSNN